MPCLTQQQHLHRKLIKHNIALNHSATTFNILIVKPSLYLYSGCHLPPSYIGLQPQNIRIHKRRRLYFAPWIFESKIWGSRKIFLEWICNIACTHIYFKPFIIQICSVITTFQIAKKAYSDSEKSMQRDTYFTISIYHTSTANF